MEEVKKVYRSKNYLSLTVALYIGEKKVVCDFTGGMSSPTRVTGSFSTTKPEVQKALEAHPWYGVEFRLESEKVKSIPDKVQAEPEKESEPVKQDKIISKATKANDAREELNKVYGVSFSKIKNINGILTQAEAIGIEYPNWDRE